MRGAQSKQRRWLRKNNDEREENKSRGKKVGPELSSSIVNTNERESPICQTNSGR
jgi:hypothetical protein